jgi:hypothetical protein
MYWLDEKNIQNFKILAGFDRPIGTIISPGFVLLNLPSITISKRNNCSDSGLNLQVGYNTEGRQRAMRNQQ